MTFISSNEVKKMYISWVAKLRMKGNDSEYDFYFIEWSEKMYFSWVVTHKIYIFSLHSKLCHSWYIHFFTSFAEIKVIFSPKIWTFFILYTKFIEVDMQIDSQYCPLAVKYKNLAVKYIFFSYVYFTCENKTFWKYALYFSYIFLYFSNKSSIMIIIPFFSPSHRCMICVCAHPLPLPPQTLISVSAIHLSLSFQKNYNILLNIWWKHINSCTTE